MPSPFSTKCPGVGGRIKRRYQDFIVEEIGAEHQCRVEHFLDEGKEVERHWPENKEGKEHLILEMEKFNTDLNNAVRTIARFLAVSNKRIGFAGMKDKRAITSQRVSVWQADMERLKAFRARNVFLKPLRWSDERIELGDLQGNRFRMTIREIGLSEREARQRIEACLKEIGTGIANFFGEQRFGGVRQVSHLVGQAMLRGEIEEAVMTYLTFTSPREKEDVRLARTNLARTKDFAQASKEFPRDYRYERALIHHLCKYPKDYAGALRKLPKNILFLFTHAFQSFLFNKVLEKRLALGLKEVEGDVLENGLPTAPLYGFESKLAEGKAGEVERQVLEEEGVKLEDFKVKSLPEVSSKGQRKAMVLKPEGLKLEAVEEDDLNEGKVKATVSFALHKGDYATTVLREIMKVDEF